METKVRVKSGVYVVLGGLIKKEARRTSSGVPWLRGLPILGHLFSNEITKDVRSEMVVMIRPTIVSGDAEVPMEEGKIGGNGGE